MTSLNHILALEDAYSDVLTQAFSLLTGTHTGNRSGIRIGDRSPIHNNKVLSDDVIQVIQGGLRHLLTKLSCTVRSLGSEALVNAYIETATRSAPATSGEEVDRSVFNADLGLKAALKTHILLSDDKLSKGSTETRRLLRLLASYASPSSLTLMEGLWREVIVDSVLLSSIPPLQPVSFFPTRCQSPHDISPARSQGGLAGAGGPGGQSGGQSMSGLHIVPGSPLSSSALSAAMAQPPTGTPIGVTPEMFSSTLVDTLLVSLRSARECSRVDLKPLGCAMSADFAFAVAYRMMPGETGVELAKALAVRISSLLDREKRSAPASSQSSSSHSNLSSWSMSERERCDRERNERGVTAAAALSAGAAVKDISDLIRVLFSQTSTEFQHFYEVLLARRLLRNRFISLERERDMMVLLPALDKSLLMIR